MELIEAWLMVSAGIMLFAAILYGLEVAPGTFYNEGSARKFAMMFFFAILWPILLVVAGYFFLKYLVNLVVSMWKSLRESEV